MFQKENSGSCVEESGGDQETTQEARETSLKRSEQDFDELVHGEK